MYCFHLFQCIIKKSILIKNDYISYGFQDASRRQGSESGIQKQQLWVAESEQKLVGFALIRCLNQLMLLAEIDALPKYHGQGIASTLLSVLIEQLEQNKETTLYLITFRNFLPSRKLYDKFGFVILQSHDIPNELQKILVEEMTAGLGARIAMKLTINPKIERK
ncbi:GNAT family N-acetyltransferase [Photorhabdus laumondii]|uniref:GNAT family N-acetyltransferase n=1 Tax=Photorhabdus laumondii TaxID=2218628 RepID=UPI00339061D0